MYNDSLENKFERFLGVGDRFELADNDRWGEYAA